MNFYYYSNGAQDFIMSTRKKGDITQSDINTADKHATLTDAVGSQLDVIPLFVYPQGKNKINEAIWLDDTKPVYENKISIDNLPVNVAWCLRDTREYNAEKERFGKSVEPDDQVEIHMNNWMRKHGHVGRGREALLKAIKKYTTNFLGKPNARLQPFIEVYPYVGYLRVTESQLKTFSNH